ncbi:nickel-dependent hydrogenase large subunit [Thermodesulfatator indicus DSM 15286]|uniref:Nickel-dependent hydrogenase large subunit n=1 Tax=Thermodesulfatator indicus (strain DSM 15286 / JCM 11887 / CIR29812) TaxID=667014 RepID=F8AE54_THEID|nr:nickel-dependent hydrogenase large subunit [Thermodesulfatator indicus]AEH44173.1 nickel-dependent hydrogenase large subunit [Thermodesulfatator indicus DSM 15286]
MAHKVTIDPVTRIEGHLRIDIEVDGGQITNAWSSGQMWRGIELIVKGKDPKDAWAFVQRICGVCTTVHALASVRAVEDALNLEIPINAQYVRNVIMAAHSLHDHIVHFYHLSALDWVDVVSALEADPKKAADLAQSISPWPGNNVNRFREVQEKLKAFVASGQLGPFENGYWGHPAMKLPPEVNLMAVSHYLEALEYQYKANQIVAIFGGKSPHIQTVVVGGVALAINPDNEATLNMERILFAQKLFEEVKKFVHQVYLPDVIAVGALYKDWLQYGAGVKNYLAVPDLPLDTKGETFDLPGGTIFNGNLAGVKPIKSFKDPYFRENVAECIAHSWYEGDWTKHPWEEETVPHYTDFQPDGKYSWSKAPRFKGEVMQVGPLAQVLVGYALGHELTKKWVDYAVEKLSSLVGGPVPLEAFHSTPGRHLARAIRAAMLAELGPKHLNLLTQNIGRGDLEVYVPPKFPKGVIKGVGFHEAPRGTLSHWVVIRDGRIENYQCVVPSTWNMSPRDDKGRMGPYEAALVGNPVADPEKPLEALRTIHSFDPCIACAVHVLNPEREELIKVKAL